MCKKAFYCGVVNMAILYYKFPVDLLAVPWIAKEENPKWICVATLWAYFKFLVVP